MEWALNPVRHEMGRPKDWRGAGPLVEGNGKWIYLLDAFQKPSPPSFSLFPVLGLGSRALYTVGNL